MSEGERRFPRMFDLSGRVALVTGGCRGLGFAIARGLASAGANVVVNGRNAPALAETTEGLARDGYRVTSAQFDVTDEEAVREGIAAVVADVGPVGILVNNAGIQRRHAIVDFPRQDWDDIIATNLTAPHVVSQSVLPAMIERRRGKIIHIASLLSEFARPSVVPYTAAKGGLRQLTRGMAVELAPHGIQVNAIAPGYFATDNTQRLRDDPQRFKEISARIPAERWGNPSDLAGAVVFLASSASNYVNGHVLVVDGGWMAR